MNPISLLIALLSSPITSGALIAALVGGAVVLDSKNTELASVKVELATMSTTLQSINIKLQAEADLAAERRLLELKEAERLAAKKEETRDYYKNLSEMLKKRKE